jgi:hypothetical protein
LDNSIGIGDLAAIVTVASIAIYVLGLIGLAVPIHIRFNWRHGYELPPIGWQLFILGSSQSDSKAFSSLLDT